jgi:hypothetical protein
MCHRTKGSAAAESWHEILISLDQQNLGNFAMLAAMPRFMAATAIIWVFGVPSVTALRCAYD